MENIAVPADLPRIGQNDRRSRTAVGRHQLVQDLPLRQELPGFHRQGDGGLLGEIVYYEVDLPEPLVIGIVQRLPVSRQLRRGVAFIHRTEVDAPDVVPQGPHVVSVEGPGQQPNIGHVQLQQVALSGLDQGEHGVAAAYRLQYDAGFHQAVEIVGVVGEPGVLPVLDIPYEDSLPLVLDVGRDQVEDRLRMQPVLLVVLGRIVAVEVQDQTLGVPEGHDVPLREELVHAIGEAPADEVIPEQVHEPLVDAVGDAGLLHHLLPDLGHQGLLDPVGPEELLEIHRIHADDVDAPYRNRRGPPQLHAQQRPAGDELVAAVGPEELQHGQEVAVLLDFVQEDQGVPVRPQLLPGHGLNGEIEVLDGPDVLEHPGALPVLDHVDLDKVGVALFPETFDDVGLPALPHALDQEDGRVVRREVV